MTTTIALAEQSVGPLAAVALANELPLYTVNPADFQDIDGLTVRSVPHPDAADTA